MKFKIKQAINAVNEPVTEVRTDPFVSLVGHFGKWQFVIFASIILVKLSSAWVQLMILFLTPQANYRCAEFNTNSTKIGEDMVCYTNCLRYEYDTSPFDNTIVSEWDLICDRQWLASLTQTVLQLGILIGSIVFGFLSDRYGRRYTFLSSVVLLIVFGLILPFSPNYIIFTVIRFFLGISTAGTMVVSFVIVMETIGSKYREITGCLYQIPFILGHMLLPLFAYYLRNWNEYTLGLAIPPLIYLGYFFVINESPRWLMSVGKIDRAVEVVTRAAEMNNLPTANIKDVVTKISNDIISNKAEEPKLNYIDLFRTSNVRLRTFCSCALWLFAGCAFFGVNQYISQTSPNPFISVAAAGAIQLPANLVAMWLMKLLGRKICVIIFFALGGICIIVLGWVPNIFWLTLALGTFGVGFVTVVITSVYIYSTELFPTVVRNMGIGLCSTSMRIGSMLAPFVSNASVAYPWLPSVIFGAVSILGAFLCLLLPETKGHKLPDSIDDVEHR